MKRYRIIVLILVLILLLPSCSISNLFSATGRRYQLKEGDVIAKETVELLVEAINGRDRDKLTELFSHTVRDKGELDEQIAATFVYFDEEEIVSFDAQIPADAGIYKEAGRQRREMVYCTTVTTTKRELYFYLSETLQDEFDPRNVGITFFGIGNAEYRTKMVDYNTETKDENCGINIDYGDYAVRINEICAVDIIQLGTEYGGKHEQEYGFEENLLFSVSDVEAFRTDLLALERKSRSGEMFYLQSGDVVIRVTFDNGEYHLIDWHVQLRREKYLHRNEFIILGKDQFNELIRKYAEQEGKTHLLPQA